jgi:hypothetical protein
MLGPTVAFVELLTKLPLIAASLVFGCGRIQRIRHFQLIDCNQSEIVNFGGDGKMLKITDVKGNEAQHQIHQQ